MVFVFFSFQAIEIAYTDTIDQAQHIVISQISPAVFQVIKEGLNLRIFLNKIAQIKDQQMLEDSHDLQLQSPVLVCLSAKSKKAIQPILQLLSPAFQKNVLYTRIDKNQFKELPFNRAALFERDICYGQGYPQLRQKQELRLAVFSIFGEEVVSDECIFIEKNANQLKELKKDGFSNIVTAFQEEALQNAFKIASNINKTTIATEQPIILKEYVSKYPFASQYLRSLIKVHKDISLKQINPFDLKKLSISGFLSSLFQQTTYFNISPKSWVPNIKSKETSAYIFHNVSDMQLCLARASKIKDFTNQQQFQIKILAYYLYFIINPSSYAVPQEKLSSLMKFCKIKSNQNKKAFFNVRPYIESLQTLYGLPLRKEDIISIFSRGEYRNQQVKGIGNLLLTSLILNDNLNVKTLCQQTALLSSMQNELTVINSQTLGHNGELFICRADFYNVLGLSNYKQLNEAFLLSNKEGQIRISLKDLHPSILTEMKQLLYEMNDQKLHMIKSLILYYRWNTKLVNYYEVIMYRLNLINQALKAVPLSPLYSNRFILNDFPELACLLLKQNYNYFIIPSKNLYSPIQYTYQPKLQSPKQAQNPFFVYINKTCSFAIYHISFPVLTFLQWIKSTNRYQIIEYISMINHTFQDYVVMDKRLKLQVTNQKKNAILIVDHVQLCEALINRPKSIKTVMIFRLRKISEIEDVGMISTEIQKRDSFRNSEDELINVLIREGSKYSNQQYQFQLYDWVFKTYIKIKCSHYNLNYDTALQFASILHKEISTNRHRLKQIKQNHPNLYVYLYTLPIVKDNQKVVYNYRLFEYLHMYQLFDKILSKKWSCRLQTYQNSSVTYWKGIIGVELAVKIVKSLMEYLQYIDKQDIESMQNGQCRNDCLELIRTITEPTKNDDEQQLPFSLYYQVFVEHINVKNYIKIKDVQTNGRFIVVLDNNSICLSTFQNSPIIFLPQEKEQHIITYCIDQKQKIFVLYINSSQILLRRVKISQQMTLASNVQALYNVTSMLMHDLLRDSLKVHLKIRKNTIHLVFEYKHKLIFMIINPEQKEQSLTQQYKFAEQIVKVKSINSASGSYLVCVTKESIYTVRIFDQFQLDASLLKKLSFKMSEKAKIVIIEDNLVDFQLIIFEGNHLQITSIASREVISTRLFQLSRPIKAITLSKHILFVFYEADDGLYLYKINESSLQDLWRYYWVESISSELYVNGNTMQIRGGSYLKKIRLQNIQTLTHLGCNVD